MKNIDLRLKIDKKLTFRERIKFLLRGRLKVIIDLNADIANNGTQTVTKIIFYLM